MSKETIFLIDKDGTRLGYADTTKLENAKWYQKAIARLFKSYESKFITVKGFEIRYKQNVVTTKKKVTLTELEGHYKSYHLSSKHFIELVKSWHKEEINKALKKLYKGYDLSAPMLIEEIENAFKVKFLKNE